MFRRWWFIRVRWLLCSFCILSLLHPILVKAQAPANVPNEVLSYPELIVYGGKLVTVDDWSLKDTIGTVAQAMAVRKGKVLAIGTNESILAFAGPQTRNIDLKGRTVLPGFVVSHDHLHDWALTHKAVLEKVISDRDSVIREVPGRTTDEEVQNLEPVLRQAVKSASPGKWIQLLLLYESPKAGPQGPQAEVIRKQRVSKETLDRLAPNNPVVVSEGTLVLLNQPAIDSVLRLYPPGAANAVFSPTEEFVKTGISHPPLARYLVPDIIYKDQVELQAKLYQQEMEWWAGYGVTTWGSAVLSSNVLAAYKLLDRTGRMPIRFGWSYNLNVNNYSLYLLQSLATVAGGKGGSPYLWLSGVAVGGISNRCTTLEVAGTFNRTSGETYREFCVFQPGSNGYQAAKDVVKAGVPIRNFHTGPFADKDVDYFLQAIAEAAREANLSDEQIRAQRQQMDHCRSAPRADQIPLFKKFGIIASCKASIVYFELPDNAPLYGERYAKWFVPRKSLLDAGVLTTTEIDNPLGNTAGTVFSTNLYTDITRKGKDGRVYSPEQRLDRVRALKAQTIWPSYSFFKEAELGSLQSGKWADFMILDRDYLTIPVDDIPKIRVLATAVGGKFVHVVREVAGELGESPKGPQALAD